MMTRNLYFTLMLLLAGCAPTPPQQVRAPQLPQTHLQPSSYSELSHWEGESHAELLEIFKRNCVTRSTKTLYGDVCDKAQSATDAKAFLNRYLQPYKIVGENGGTKGLMTGYYEAMVFGSLTRNERYKYPLYGVPEDMIRVDFSEMHPELKGKRLRGRLENGKLVPYYERREIDKANAPVICWVDDALSLFLLEVQGSGRVMLDTGEIMQVGYADQNGHPYQSIGKYLVALGEIPQEKISIDSIRRWFIRHPERMQEILNHNPSVVFFRQRSGGVTGSLGIELRAERSIAVDKRYIPLGAMLYVKAENDYPKRTIERSVFAQDTGGAIKGALRADFFYGFGDEAGSKAGGLMADTEFWILLPKESLR